MCRVLSVIFIYINVALHETNSKPRADKAEKFLYLISHHNGFTTYFHIQYNQEEPRREIKAH